MLSKSRVHAGMSATRDPSAGKECTGRVKHSIVSPGDSDIMKALLQINLYRSQVATSTIKIELNF